VSALVKHGMLYRIHHWTTLGTFNQKKRAVSRIKRWRKHINSIQGMSLPTKCLH